MKKLLILILPFLVIFATLNIRVVKAETLNENIENQLEKIDFSELSNFFEENGQDDFVANLEKLLKGNYDFSFNNIKESIKNLILNDFRSLLPNFFITLSIVLICEIFNIMKGNSLSKQTTQIVNSVCFISVFSLVIIEIIKVFQNTINIIENIAKLNEIMSPIILTLMIASGGSVSANIYKPTVAFLSSGITSIFLNILVPIVGVMFVFNILSGISTSIKLDKFMDTLAGVFKWIMGISITVFTVFLSIQGLSSASFDGISLKAAKYAISNSIPIVGGFIRDGFDLVIAGSLIIKNAVGLSSLFCLFYIVISPLLFIFTLSTMLKFFAGIIELFSSVTISSVLIKCSKTLSYLTAIILVVSLIFFVTVLLMIVSANSFI